MVVRVVLVDDVPEWRRLVATALRLHGGFEVVGQAPDGASAVTVATAAQPDVVVLDLGLPDIAGGEVITHLRECSPTSKIVVLSGTPPGDRPAVAGQVDGYVVKDLELGYLVDLLTTLGRGPRGATITLPHELTAGRQARQFARQVLAACGPGVPVDETLLVVSELVTNAVIHGGAGCELRLSVDVASVRVEVSDPGAGTPDLRAPSESREHGRGLHLVSAVCSAWGLELFPGGGKRVWVELPRTQ